MKIKSKPTVLKKVADSKYFHNYWEDLQKKIGKILSEAHNPDGTMNDWTNSIDEATDAIAKISSLGWDVRHGNIIE